MKSNICLICKRVISEHSRRENIECALKLIDKMGIASSARGTGDQLIQKPTSGAVESKRGFLIEY